jgi:hypothetical protein
MVHGVLKTVNERGDKGMGKDFYMELAGGSGHKREG